MHPKNINITEKYIYMNYREYKIDHDEATSTTNIIIILHRRRHNGWFSRSNLAGRDASGLDRQHPERIGIFPHRFVEYSS